MTNDTRAERFHEIQRVTDAVPVQAIIADQLRIIDLWRKDMDGKPPFSSTDRRHVEAALEEAVFVALAAVEKAYVANISDCFSLLHGKALDVADRCAIDARVSMRTAVAIALGLDRRDVPAEEVAS